MGKYVNGINGAFTGKVGNLIGSSWRGIPYMKSRSVRTKPATEGEKINRFVFGMTQQWLKPLKEFLRIGFNNYTLTNQGVNAAKSFLYKNALVKDGLDSTIDPTLVKVSHGDLPLPARMDVELRSDNKLIFTWDPKSKEVNELDQVMLLAYDIENGEATMKILGQFRETGRDGLSVKGLNNFVVYAAFVSADRNSQSDSVYLGSFTTFEIKEPKKETDPESKATAKNTSADSTGIASNTTSKENPEIEIVPKNQLNLFEPLDEQVDHLQNNVTLSETKADTKQGIPEKPSLTKSQDPVKQKFTYINPNIEIENESAESADIGEEEPDEKIVIKKDNMTYITSKKHLNKTRHKGRS